MTPWSLFLQTLSLLHHFLGLYYTPQPYSCLFPTADCGLPPPSADVRYYGNYRQDSPGAYQGDQP